MSGSLWLPGLIVLAVGLAVGLALAWRFARTGRGRGADENLRHEIEDLEARRDDLYRRLRELPRDDATTGERQALELAAARVLRDLDRLGPLREPRSGVADAAPRPAAARSSGIAGRHPLLVGFVAGGVAVAAIGGLIYVAGRDATPQSPPPQQVAGELPPDHPEIGPGSAEAAARLQALQERVAADPEDLVTRKQLALLQLAVGQYFESFEHAQEILRRVPEDPDGLFILGVVRVAMGQFEEAVEQLDRVLAMHPDHVQALVYRGLALYQAGQVERAIDSWEVGLETAGGREPQIEQLLTMARQGNAPPSEPVVAAPPVPATAPGPGEYGLRIELAEGARVPSTAVLFVSLRGAETGPPVAVRRISSPRFPLEITLGSVDSMMGAELPAEGFVSARLDGDGSASTREEGDLSVQTPARGGGTYRLVLGGS